MLHKIWEQKNNLWALSLLLVVGLVLGACASDTTPPLPTPEPTETLGEQTPVESTEEAVTEPEVTEEIITEPEEETIDFTPTPQPEAAGSEFDQAGDDLNENNELNPDQTSSSEQPAAEPNPTLLNTLMQDMTLVWLEGEDYAFAKTVCAGTGLNNVELPASGTTKILIPNAGDLAVNGSNVAIEMDANGEITFIPRTPEQRILVPMAVGERTAGEEVLSLTLAEVQELAAAGGLVWTAQNEGPYGDGRGLPGHIAACDPLYEE
jgi:hypothetical protein